MVLWSDICSFKITMRDSYSGSFERLENILAELRISCPWDKNQTTQSLRKLTIEETYELADAIDEHNWDHIAEELGDLLLHIMFYTKIASEENKFSREDVIRKVCKKLVNRHPHIYERECVANENDVKKNWENLKLKEGKTGVLSGVPKSLPAMIKAFRLQEKAKQVGFEWETAAQVKEKINEEWQEFETELAKQDKVKMEQEFGDILFSMVNYARFLNIDPEAALEKTNKKFISRFNKMEAHAIGNTESLSALTLEELDIMWKEAKKGE